MERKKILESLIKMEGSIDSLMAGLNSFSWDSDEALVTLTKVQVLMILGKFIENKMKNKLTKQLELINR